MTRSMTALYHTEEAAQALTSSPAAWGRVSLIEFSIGTRPSLLEEARLVRDRLARRVHNVDSAVHGAARARIHQAATLPWRFST